VTYSFPLIGRPDTTPGPVENMTGAPSNAQRKYVFGGGRKDWASNVMVAGAAPISAAWLSRVTGLFEMRGDCQELCVVA
jgi:hypothetical protein